MKTDTIHFAFLHTDNKTKSSSRWISVAFTDAVSLLDSISVLDFRVA